MTPEQFREIRHKHGLTQLELARVLGLSSFMTVSRYERGVIPVAGAIEVLMKHIDKYGKGYL